MKKPNYYSIYWHKLLEENVAKQFYTKEPGSIGLIMINGQQ